MDISAAFLKGMTYEKISALTGEPLRSVQFDFPRHDAWLLQQLPIMQAFNYHTEVLDLIKALWGLKDAPRAFGLKLAETLKNDGYVQGIQDPQLWRKFDPKQSKRSKPIKISEIKSDLDPGRDEEDEQLATQKSCKRNTEIGEEALGKDVLCITSSIRSSVSITISIFL